MKKVQSINGESCCSDECITNLPGLYVQMCSMDKKIQGEKMSSEILGLYKQMKLQETINNTPFLDENSKKNLLYTNARYMNDISQKIHQYDIDYSRTYANLTADQNTNSILNAIQNRTQHLNTNPFGT